MKKKIAILITSFFCVSCSDKVGFRLRASLDSKEMVCFLNDPGWQRSYDKESWSKGFQKTHNSVKYNIITFIDKNNLTLEVEWPRKGSNILLKDNGDKAIKKYIINELNSLKKCAYKFRFYCQNFALKQEYYEYFCSKSDVPNIWLSTKIN